MVFVGPWPFGFILQLMVLDIVLSVGVMKDAPEWCVLLSLGEEKLPSVYVTCRQGNLGCKGCYT